MSVRKPWVSPITQRRLTARSILFFSTTLTRDRRRYPPWPSGFRRSLGKAWSRSAMRSDDSFWSLISPSSSKASMLAHMKVRWVDELQMDGLRDKSQEAARGWSIQVRCSLSCCSGRVAAPPPNRQRHGGAKAASCNLSGCRNGPTAPHPHIKRTRHRAPDNNKRGESTALKGEALGYWPISRAPMPADWARFLNVSRCLIRVGGRSEPGKNPSRQEQPDVRSGGSRREGAMGIRRA